MRVVELEQGGDAPDLPVEERLRSEAVLIEKAKAESQAFGDLYEAHYSRITEVGWYLLDFAKALPEAGEEANTTHGTRAR